MKEEIKNFWNLTANLLSFRSLCFVYGKRKGKKWIGEENKQQ